MAAEAALIGAVSGNNKSMVPLLMRNRDNLKVQLLGEKPSLLVKMGVQRVIACWLFVHYIDMRYAEIMEGGARISEWGRMQVQAEKRFQLALSSLELIRKIDGLPKKAVSAVASASQAETSNAPVTMSQPTRESDSQSLGMK